MTVAFTDASTNTPTSWLWDFGDGSQSTNQNPSHVYAAAGTYTVALTATNVYGSGSLTKTGYITVAPVNPSPIAAFIAIPTSTTVGTTINFHDTSANSPTSWSWNFGDGHVSNDQNPSHIYTSAGVYDVSLTVTNSYGTNSLTKTGYITITPGLIPVAAFSASPTNTYVMGTVVFTDASTNTPTSWLWDFGDGSQSTSQNPSYAYSAAGTYTVSLTATNVYGSDTMTKTGYITISGPVPTTPPTGYVITETATGVSNNTVTMNGYTSSGSYKYYFEYGYSPGVYSYATAQTTGTDPGGNFSETVSGIPLLADETYYYRAVINENDHYVNGNELSYTLTQSAPVDVYPEFKSRGENLINANWDFDTLLTVIPSPFVDLMGAIFYGIIIGGAFIVLWARTKKIIIPSLFGIISGAVLFNILPPQWVVFGSALFYVSIGGFLYGIIVGRQS
jgi:PKD repeat protein